MTNPNQLNCPAFLGFLTHNTETPVSELKAAIKKLLTGADGHNKALELYGPSDSGKQLFLDLLIALVGKKNTIRISIEDKIIPKCPETKDYQLIIVHESLSTLNKRELGNLESLITNKKLRGLVVKVAEVHNSMPKPLPIELATTVCFKRNRASDYQLALNNAIDNELEAIRRWALED